VLQFQSPEIDAFWQQACAATGIDPATTHHAGPFAEATEDSEWAGFVDELSALAAAGQKRGTAHMKLQFEHEAIPMRKPGDGWIVTTVAKRPVCLVRMTNIAIVPWNEVTEEFAASEGEGDLSLRHWREAHFDYFQEQLERWGETWREDMPIVCESFALAWKPDTDRS